MFQQPIRDFTQLLCIREEIRCGHRKKNFSFSSPMRSTGFPSTKV